LDYKYDTDKIAEQVEKQIDNFVSKDERTEKDLRKDILNSALKTANTINEFNMQLETKKHFWRKFFMIFFCSMLFVSFVAIVGLLICGKITDLQLGVLTSSMLAEIFAIVFFMVKYVHNDLYLETFKTVTQKLLDYLIQDKDNNDNPDD